MRVAATRQALPRLCNHRLREIDANNLRGVAIIVEGQPGPDPNLKNSPTNFAGRRGRCPPSGHEYRTAYRVVDRRPPCIGLFDRFLIEITAHHRSPPPKDSHAILAA